MTDPFSTADRGERLQTVESVRRALRILKCFSLDSPEWGVTELARMLNMHKSTIHRLVTTMEREGFLYQVENGRYALSFAIFEIAAGVVAWQGIHDTLLKHLRELVEQTGETAHLAVLDQESALYVEKVEGTWALRMPSAVGRHVPLNCTSLGKVLLAGMESDECRRIVYETAWVARTAHSITDPDLVMKEIIAVRERGYAVDHQEIEEGLMCIAAPVRDDRGVTCAGVSIAGPAPRLANYLEDRVQCVKDAAARLSAALGPQARRLREAGRMA